MLFLSAMGALAASYVISDDPITIPVDPDTGLTVQLPEPIVLVTPTETLEIERIGEAGAVRHLQIHVLPNAVTEMVTFVTSAGTAIPVTFVPAQTLDSFADLRLPPTETSFRSGGFLSPEREMMHAMLRESRAGRTIMVEQHEFAQYPELEWTLRRKYRGNGITGYVFVVENITKRTLRLDESVLSVGFPNRAALIQLDRNELLPCDESDVWKQEQTCRTALRLVVRDEGTNAPIEVGSELPFVVRGRQ